jgi:class 3 adenylate cyclase
VRLLRPQRDPRGADRGPGRGGEILVSESLKEMAGDSDLSFDGGRELELKGLSGTHEVFTAHWEEQPATPGSA